MKETVMTEAKRRIFCNLKARKTNQIMKATLVMTEAKRQIFGRSQVIMSTVLFQT